MAIVDVKELLSAGVHFGHKTSRWNPKMEPYIFGKRNTIHIIDLRETIRGIITADRFLSRIAENGDYILFVGTKRQAKGAIEREAKRCGMPYVNERWLGGTLTNFTTIRSRLSRLEQLEELEKTGEIERYSKKIISSLQRERQKIQRNLQGIRDMDKLPGVLVVIDPKREKIAVAEANKLGIPTVCLTDTDCDPDAITVCVPGNDDSMKAIEIFCIKMANAVVNGKVGHERVQLKTDVAIAANRNAEVESESARPEGAVVATEPQIGNGISNQSGGEKHEDSSEESQSPPIIPEITEGNESASAGTTEG